MIFLLYGLGLGVLVGTLIFTISKFIGDIKEMTSNVLIL